MAQKGTIVQVTNGQHLRCLPPTQQPTSLRDFLLTAPRGAYTTGLVKDAFSITEWELHVARLVKSIAAMHGSIPGFFDVYYRWLMENVSSLYRPINYLSHTIDDQYRDHANKSKVVLVNNAGNCC